MKCPKCGRKIKPSTLLLKEHATVKDAIHCPCGYWKEPEIIPVKPIPPKYEFSEERKEASRKGLEIARAKKASKKELELQAADELRMTKKRGRYVRRNPNTKKSL